MENNRMASSSLEREDEELRQRADGGHQPGQRKHDPGDEVKSYENIINMSPSKLFSTIQNLNIQK